MVLPGSGTTPTTAADASSSPKLGGPTAKALALSRGGPSLLQRFLNQLSHFSRSCVQWKGEFLERIEHRYESYGHHVYDHPWRYILWPLVFCSFCSAGLLWRRVELDMVKLYGLPGCLPHVALAHLQGVFPIERIEYIFAVSRDGGGILTKEKLSALDQMWTKVKRLRVPKALMEAAIVPGELRLMGDWLREHHPEFLRYEADWDPTAPAENYGPSADFIALEDVCVYDGFGSCKMTGVLDLYNSRRMYGQPIRTREWPQYVNLRSQRAFRIDAMLGGITKAERAGGSVELLGATSAAFRIDLDGTSDRVDWASAWEQGLVSLIQSLDLPGIKLHIKAERSLADELALSSQLRGDDLIMLLIAAVLVSLFTCAMNWSSDPYRSKLFPALVGVTTTLFSYGGGVGICHLLGLPHVPPSEATPFIVLAINVDDVFVITNAYSMTYLHSHCSRSRVGMALRDAGISVTLTTVTNIVAFAIGASSVYFSIQIFCIVTASALLVGFLLSLTVFAGALAISAKLEEKHRPADVLQEVRARSAALGAYNRAVECKSASRVQDARRPFVNNALVPHSQPTTGAGGGGGGGRLLEMATTAETMPAAAAAAAAGLSTPRHQQQPPAFEELLRRPLDVPPGGAATIRCRSPNPAAAAAASAGCATGNPLRRRPSLREAGNRAMTADDSDRVSAVVSRRDVCPIGTPAATAQGKQGFYLIEDLTNQWVFARRIEEYYRSHSRHNHHGSRSPSQQATASCCRSSQPAANAPSATQLETLRGSNNDEMPLESSFPEWAAQAPEEDDNGEEENNEAEAEDEAESENADDDDVLSYASLTLASTSGAGGTLPAAIDVDKLRQLVWVDNMLYPAEAVNLEEPKGTVGRHAREAFLRYVGSVLILRPVKIAIFGFFLCLFAYSCYCSTQVSAGIKVKDVAPLDSYFREVVDIRETDYDSYGEECIVFFHKGGRWWDADVQAELLGLVRAIREDEHVVFLMSGLEDFLTSSYHRSSAAEGATDRERKLAFTRDWQDWVESPRGRNFGKFFLRDYDGTPSLMKFYYWMEYTDNSEVSQRWMLRIQRLLQDQDRRGLLSGGEVFTPLALMWESDPIIFRATIWNMVVAMASMGVVAMVLIPDLLSGFLVLCVILMIYTNVYGFMFLWDLPLNMLTMVNLVLAIGFAVDYTAHITHTFNHCRGRTRNARVIETVVMMGLPISNGMLSTYVAIAALSMSKKYTLVVIFKMTTTIIASAFIHGMFFMPVLLSVVGPLNRREVSIVQVRDNAVKDSWAVDLTRKRPVSRAMKDTVKLDKELRTFSRWTALNRKNYGVM